MHRTLFLSMLCLAGTVTAQGERLDLQDDVPIDTYLALLRAFAQGNGDPVLMNMVRASHERDTAALQRLGASIACPSK